VLFLVAAGVSTVGSLILLIAAFRVSVGWGFAVLLLPFANIVFAVKHWDKAKLGILLQVAGVALVTVAVFAFGLDAVMAGRGGGFEGNEMPSFGGAVEPSPTAPPPTPTAPPTPEPAPTVYLPEALLDYTPAARPVMPRPTVGPEEDFVLTLQNASQRVGWTMKVTTTDGRYFEGTLLAIDGRSMTFERRLNTGSMIFPIPIADIQKLELAQ
jgi:hypothetical protein